MVRRARSSAGAFRATTTLAGVRRTVCLTAVRGAAFLAAAFLATAVLATAFRAAGFLTAGFRAAGFRAAARFGADFRAADLLAFGAGRRALGAAFRAGFDAFRFTAFFAARRTPLPVPFAAVRFAARAGRFTAFRLAIGLPFLTLTVSGK
jgi:hypothetical protein